VVYVTLPDAEQKVECCIPARVVDKMCDTNNLDKSLQCDQLKGDILAGRAETFPYRRARIQDEPPCLGCKPSDIVWDAFCVPSFKDALDQQHERCYIAVVQNRTARREPLGRVVYVWWTNAGHRAPSAGIAPVIFDM
jgi:hypothetical protein